MAATFPESAYGQQMPVYFTPESNQNSNATSDNNNSSDNSVSPSSSSQPQPNSNTQTQQAKANYVQSRTRNNEAAKISRRNRRLREAEMAMRAAHLEQENIMLRAEISTLTTEIAALRQMATANALLPPTAHYSNLPPNAPVQAWAGDHYQTYTGSL